MNKASVRLRHGSPTFPAGKDSKMPSPVSVTPALLRKYSQVFPVGSAGTRHPARLIERRKAHLRALDSFAVFSGVDREPGSEHLWIMSVLRIFQEPALIHLTCINQPKVILALDQRRKRKFDQSHSRTSLQTLNTAR